MAVFCGTIVFLNLCLLSSGMDSDSDTVEAEMNKTKTFQLELFPSDPIYAGQTRTPRKLFQKLHSGAAFLTGVKLGAVLSKKGFELGHGKITSAHSFHLFGKPVHSASSLSYGESSLLSPLDVSDPETKTILKKDKKVFHVTVEEDPPTTQPNSGEVKKSESVVMLYQDVEPDDFTKNHNEDVKTRRRANSKF